MARRATLLIAVLAAAAVSLGLVTAATGESDGVSVTRQAKSGPQPCPRVSVEPIPYGGCILESSADPLTVRVYTPVGSFLFGNCELDVELYVNRDGSAWLGDFAFSDAVGEGDPCLDIGPCSTKSGQFEPWPSQIKRKGEDEASLQVDVCLDTCVGKFVGPVTLPLELENGILRALHFDEVQIGDSGIVLDGRVSLEGDADVEISAAGG